MQSENLQILKDDMVAFIEGHGMRRLPGFVNEDIPSVEWDDNVNPDSWKDFVELAKAASAPFLTMSEIVLEKDDLELLVEQLRGQNFPEEDAPEIEEAVSLMSYLGKTGYVQLGFAHQGIMFIHETSTAWYDRYQQLLEKMEEFSDIVFEAGDAAEDENESL